MTTTAPDVDLTTLKALDWQHEPPCTAEGCRHGRPPARWRVTLSCRCVVLSCDPCKRDVDEIRATETPCQCGTARCRLCLSPVPCNARDHVISVEPLQ